MIDGTSVYGLSGCARTHWRQPSKPLSPGVDAGPFGGSVIGLTVAPASTKCANCARIASLVPVVPNGSLNADAGHADDLAGQRVGLQRGRPVRRAVPVGDVVERVARRVDRGRVEQQREVAAACG